MLLTNQVGGLAVVVIGVILSVEATPAPASITAACQTLSGLFEQSVSLPDDATYVALSAENWSETDRYTPSCIFQPASVSDLQTAVPLLSSSRVPFAIRSGGHSPSPGAANIDQGVLIDLSKFDHVIYSAATATASLGAGQKWGNVYTQLQDFNVTVVGGRDLDVGVGGLILGGGLSYHSDLYGLVCDNVVKFELVLANGSIAHATASTNPDLFWALKGGGNNFGVVTSFTLSTYPIGQVWGGLKGYMLDALPQLLSAMYEYQNTANKDPYANLFLQGYPVNETFGVLLTLVYLKPEINTPAFSPFYHINTTFDTTTVSSFVDFLNASAQAAKLPPRIDWFTSTYYAPTRLFYEQADGIIRNSSALADIRSITGGSTSFSIQPISSSLVEAGFVKGGNALGLAPRNQTWFKVDSGWLFPEDDQAIHHASKQYIDEVNSAASNVGIKGDYLFMNDASWDQPVIKHYGEQNMAKLRAISEKYDPHSVFQKLVPGGFKIPVW